MASHFENNPSFTYECPLTRTGKRSAHSTCAKKFAEDYGFQLIESSDDGNCFFYTLTEFGKRSGYNPLRLRHTKHDNAMALREQLVDYIESHFEEYAHFLVNNNNNNNNNDNNNNSKSIYQQIHKLRKNGAWASNAGDLVPIVAPNVFGIHINLYNIIVGNDGDHIQLVPIRSQTPTNVFVSIMRVREGHFQLLWPRSGVYTSIQNDVQTLSRNRVNSRTTMLNHISASKDVVHAAHLAVSAAQIAVSAAKASSSSSPSPSPSLTKNEQKLNQIIQDLNQLSINAPRRSTRSTRSTSSKSTLYKNSLSSPVNVKQNTRRKKKSQIPSSASYLNNNNELRRALEASMYNK